MGLATAGSARPPAAPMSLSAPTTLTALSPLDGRYAAKVAPLRALLSEYGLMHRRVQVEVEWFIALSDAGFSEFKPLSEATRGMLRGLGRDESDSLIHERGQVEVGCDFCGEQYRFDAVDVGEMFTPPRDQPPIVDGVH